MALLAPHFDLPFRLLGSSFVCVEQDTFEDITNCVETIVRAPEGSRVDVDPFGIPDPTFSIIPIDTHSIESIISEQEPRAVQVITYKPDLIDNLLSHVRVSTEVSQ